jgi:hypothetical protein
MLLRRRLRLRLLLFLVLSVLTVDRYGHSQKQDGAYYCCRQNSVQNFDIHAIPPG